MSEHTFTPGPWMADDPSKCGLDGQWGVWHLDSGGPICWVGDPYPRGDNHPYENMVLISAAPELLAACEAAAEHFTDSMDHDCPDCAAIEDQLRAAIAKARGEQ